MNRMERAGVRVFLITAGTGAATVSSGIGLFGRDQGIIMRCPTAEVGRGQRGFSARSVLFGRANFMLEPRDAVTYT